jgi:NTP pyrophosphatase (non-canonical NTP hydrolase)
MSGFDSVSGSDADIMGCYPSDINAMCDVIHQRNREAGWWDKPREDGTLLMLCVSELAEAMEGSRKGLMDDHLPHRKMEEVELGDAIIRICDYAGAKGYDLGGAILEKLQYNAHREDHKREVRAQAGGKAY